MTLRSRIAISLGVALALLAASATVHAPPARASTPCWKRLLNDWYDGRIDDAYPVACYQQALRHLPADVQTYSSAHDDIFRALQSAIATRRARHEPVVGTTPVPPEQRAQSTTTSGGGGSAGGGGGTTSGGTTTAGGGSGGGKGSGGIAGAVTASSPSSVPVPLIVLGALALLLVAAGGAGLVAKRVQARRAGP